MLSAVLLLLKNGANPNMPLGNLYGICDVGWNDNDTDDQPKEDDEMEDFRFQEIPSFDSGLLSHSLHNGLSLLVSNFWWYSTTTTVIIP